MRTVDFHSHLVTDVFRRNTDRLGTDPIEEDGFPLPDWSVEKKNIRTF